MPLCGLLMTQRQPRTRTAGARCDHAKDHDDDIRHLLMLQPIRRRLLFGYHVVCVVSITARQRRQGTLKRSGRLLWALTGLGGGEQLHGHARSKNVFNPSPWVPQAPPLYLSTALPLCFADLGSLSIVLLLLSSALACRQGLWGLRGHPCVVRMGILVWPMPAGRIDTY